MSDAPGSAPGPPAGPPAINDDEAGDSTEGSADRSGTERLLFFSDAIFAIAITLLAIDIRIPADLPSNTDNALIGAIRDLAVTAALSAVLFVYPVRAGLTATSVTPDMARHIEYRAAVVPQLFLASIPIARFVGPYAAETSWILGFPLQAFLTRHFGIGRAFAQ
jgi:hypothetical protein